MSGAPEAKKAFIPLESNPEVFTELLHNLGISRSLAFTDVLSLDDPELIALVPRPVLGLVFIFPGQDVSEAYKKARDEQEAGREEYTGSGPDEDVVWFKQTIGNACGLHALLHCVTNGPAREYIEQDSILSRLLDKSIPLTPNARAREFEDNAEIEAAHAAAAHKGDSAVPPDPHVEAPFAYIAFVKSHKNGHLYQMAGYYKGPIDMGPIGGEDLLGERAVNVVKEFVAREKGENVNFGLLALAPVQN
ncbi:ubiquitin C-terminal hydrolase [Heliocybe sulcata]|uniref:Ubiquitin carboxyl-terminal hydrolase n=1 Tax=Heliocybe sulcata TaxID=5364 RepID=A0A5C3NIQ8_9AGAM|nr:ubiquitin C-terminal hydrolase [Heliocybe sulcata]